MKTKSIAWWNKIQKDEATNSEAIQGDLCTLIDGVAFLIQRRNNWNNVICIRIKPNKRSLLNTFSDFRHFCELQKIQYIRVEGIGKHTYKMLYLILRNAPKECGVIKERKESKETGRSIYYVKTY